MSIRLTLLCGPVVPVPAPPSLTMALSQVEVTRDADGPSGCNLVFNTTKGMLGLDYDLVNSPQLLQYNRVIVMVTIGMLPKVLFDGFVTSKQLATGEGEQGAKLTVTCEDVSVKMDMVEAPFSYPMFLDIAKVGLILSKYSILGVVPVVIPPETDTIDVETNDQQMCSDKAQLQMLASAVGHVFYVMPGPLPLMNVAYWGPQHRVFPPQPPLTANLGPESNVESITAKHAGLAPQVTWGTKLVRKAPMPYVNAVAYTRLPPFALEGLMRSIFVPLGLAPESFPAMLPILPVRARHDVNPCMDIAESLGAAQSQTDLAADKTATLSGELDATRYGSVLVAPGIVGVRGVGIGLDGFYNVQSVTHSINLDYGQMDYKQSFDLVREGFGTTTPIVAGLTTPGI